MDETSTKNILGRYHLWTLYRKFLRPPSDNNKAVTPNPYIYIWDTVPLMKKAWAKANTVDVQPPTLSFAQQGPLRHDDTIVDVQWSPDGRYLATASLDHKVIVWKVDGA